MVPRLRPLFALMVLLAATARAQSGAPIEARAEATSAERPAPAPVVEARGSAKVEAKTEAKTADVQAAPKTQNAAPAAAGPTATVASGELEALPGIAPDSVAATSIVETVAPSAAKAERGALSDDPLPNWAPEGIDPDQLDERGESMAGTLLRTVLVLGVVLAAIYLTLNVGLRRLMGLGTTGARGNQALVSVVERHAVGPRHALLVVRAGTDYLVVGQTEAGMSLLSKIEPSQVEAHAVARAAAPTAQVPALSPFLQKLLARKGDTRQSPPPPPAA